MKKNLLFIFSVLIINFLSGQEIYKVETKKIIAPIPPTLWGLFFEDINRGADGGLYGEMVENNSFDFPDPMMGWGTWPNQNLRDGIFLINDQSAENSADPKFLSINTSASDTVGIVNQSFIGMYFKKGMEYSLSIRFRKITPGISIRISLLDGDNKDLSHTIISLDVKAIDWSDVFATLVPSDSTTNGKLLVTFEGEGQLDVDRISLFPHDTWKHAFGLRSDLVQKLADLHPGFLRFPGGCIVEGNQLVNRYQWKPYRSAIYNNDGLQKISGTITSRQAQQTPDYFQSFGLGFLEYFELCEQIGAEPLPVVNCGMSCQFDAAEVTPLQDLKPYIDDALDLIEFANGNAQTKWGAKRVALGHPTPFHLKMLSIGNENWGPQYIERLKIFTIAIKNKYPDILKSVTSTDLRVFQIKI